MQTYILQDDNINSKPRFTVEVTAQKVSSGYYEIYDVVLINYGGIKRNVTKYLSKMSELQIEQGIMKSERSGD